MPGSSCVVLGLGPCGSRFVGTFYCTARQSMLRLQFSLFRLCIFRGGIQRELGKSFDYIKKVIFIYGKFG